MHSLHWIRERKGSDNLHHARCTQPRPEYHRWFDLGWQYRNVPNDWAASLPHASLRPSVTKFSYVYFAYEKLDHYERSTNDVIATTITEPYEYNMTVAWTYLRARKGHQPTYRYHAGWQSLPPNRCELRMAQSVATTDYAPRPMHTLPINKSLNRGWGTPRAEQGAV